MTMARATTLSDMWTYRDSSPGLADGVLVGHVVLIVAARTVGGPWEEVLHRQNASIANPGNN